MNLIYKTRNIFMRIFLFVLMIFFMFSCTDTKKNQDFPFYKQSNSNSCGPACLRMIFKYYGEDYTEEYLNKITHADSVRGTSFLDLNDAANLHGLIAKGVKINFDELNTMVPLPCIVHWNPNHFVVVYKIENSKIYVADPGDSLKVYTKEEFCDSWFEPEYADEKAGVALVFEKRSAN